MQKTLQPTRSVDDHEWSFRWGWIWNGQAGKVLTLEISSWLLESTFRKWNILIVGRDDRNWSAAWSASYRTFSIETQWTLLFRRIKKIGKQTIYRFQISNNCNEGIYLWSVAWYVSVGSRVFLEPSKHQLCTVCILPSKDMQLSVPVFS